MLCMCAHTCAHINGAEFIVVKGNEFIQKGQLYFAEIQITFSGGFYRLPPDIPVFIHLLYIT